MTTERLPAVGQDVEYRHFNGEWRRGTVLQHTFEIEDSVTGKIDRGWSRDARNWRIPHLEATDEAG